MQEAGLLFGVQKTRLYLNQYQPVPGYTAIQREDNGQVMGVVGSTFGALSHEQAMLRPLESILPTLEESLGEATVKAFSLHNKRRGLGGEVDGSKGMVEMRFHDAEERAEGPRGTSICPNLTTTHGLAGNGSLLFVGGLFSTVCLNGMVVGRKDWSKAIRHTSEIRYKLEQAEHLVLKAMAGAKSLAASLDRAREKRVDKTIESLRYILTGSPLKGKRECRSMNKIFDAYHNAPGADPGTCYGLIQAATYHATHTMGRQGGFSSESSAARAVRNRAFALAKLADNDSPARALLTLGAGVV